MKLLEEDKYEEIVGSYVRRDEEFLRQIFNNVPLPLQIQ